MRRDQRVDLVLLRDIGLDGDRLAAGALDLFGDGVRVLAVDVGDDDLRALLGVAGGDRGAEAAARSGDDGDLAGQLAHAFSWMSKSSGSRTRPCRFCRMRHAVDSPRCLDAHVAVDDVVQDRAPVTIVRVADAASARKVQANPRIRVEAGEALGRQGPAVDGDLAGRAVVAAVGAGGRDRRAVGERGHAPRLAVRAGS